MLKLEVTLTEADLKKVALKAVELIKKRTASGKDAKGSAFKKYSERWFARPAGGITRSKMKLLSNEAKRSNDNVVFFKTKAGKSWLLINGYKKFKSIVYPDEFQGGTVNLRATGDMLDGLGYINADSKAMKFTLGWVDTELAERAFFNEEKGRSLLGLTDDEI
ncbi:MAG TPA: hypothetical protein DCS19_01560, partial [Flavobacterium sp.]|nr:hypothetical protein [Flavobacterium sp.]